MAIDLLNLQPTVISRDLSNKYILLAAPYKFGKTTFMCNIPGALILSFEPGLNAHGGVYAQKINKWADLKLVYKELQKPAVMEKFKCVCFDTIEIAATMCQDFVCQQAGVQTLADVPYGKLYKAYEAEFSRIVRGIAMLGYGCIFASHTETKEIPTKQENVTIERLQPKLDKRAFDIINGLVDVIGVGVMEFDEKGLPVRKLYSQETPTVRAGNRFTYFPAVIDFSYDAVLKSLTDAIEREGENKPNMIVDKIDTVEEKLSFAEVRAEAQNLWKKITENNPDDAQVVLKKIEMTAGRKMRLSEFTEDMVDILYLVVVEMREMV